MQKLGKKQQTIKLAQVNKKITIDKTKFRSKTIFHAFKIKLKFLFRRDLRHHSKFYFKLINTRKDLRK